MKNYSTIFFCFLFAFRMQAQTGTISGVLKDKNGSSIAFANTVLLHATDSTLVKAAITDESGKFEFENVNAGRLLFMTLQVGYKSFSKEIEFKGINYAMPDVVLDAGVVNLKEAHITATKPLIEHQVDKTVVNVENSIINTGSTAIEILKRSPGISVDNDGNISLKGKQGVLVMIDGKPTYLSASDLFTMLKNMRSDELSKIEIITNPSAKYDAAGNSGVINIKLRKKQNLGLNGSARVSYGQGVYPDFGTGINLNYRNQKFNVFGSYDYEQSFYFEKNTLLRNFQQGDDVSKFDQFTFDKARSENHSSRAGMDIFINSKHTLGVLSKVNFNTNDDKTVSTTYISKNLLTVPDSGYSTVNKSNGKWNNYSFNINHRFEMDTTGRELTTDIDFAKYENRKDFNFVTDYFSDLPGYIPYTETERNEQPATITIQSAKMDYSQPVGIKMKLEAGLKSSYVVTDNDVRYFKIIDNTDIPDTGKTNRFTYRENINAAYVSLQREFGKIQAQLGLRAEQTSAKGEQLTTNKNFTHDYLQLFPSAFLSYKPNDKNQFGLNYSRRIDRPAYEQLNPFKYYLDPRTYQEGNPDLDPQMTHSVELSHTYLDAITTTINYSHTVQAMTEISKQNEATYTTFVTTENFEAHDNYGLSVTIPYQITKWWLTSNNINVFNNQFKGLVESFEVNKRLTTYMAYTYNSIKLPRGWTVELSAYYNSKMVWATFLIDPQYSVSAGIAKSFFKDRLNLRVNINDIFKTEQSTASVKYNKIDFTFHQVQDSQFVRFHLAYNFGKRTVEQARRRNSGAQDEQNRVRTGK